MDNVTWHPALNRWLDQTGMVHAVGEPDANGQVGPMCGAKVYVGGGYNTAREAGGRECKNCRRILDARRKG